MARILMLYAIVACFLLNAATTTSQVSPQQSLFDGLTMMRKVAVSSRACLIAHDEPLPLSHAAPRVNRKFPAIQEPRVGDSVEGDSPDLHTVGSA